MGGEVRDARFDFRGGVNTTFSQEVLQPNELRAAQNLRLNKFGALVKCAGSQRLHGTAIASGADVIGVFQWDESSEAGQVVAVAGGNFYHKAIADANFTEVSSSLSTTNAPWFQPHILSGTETLYIADGSLRKWNGTTLTTSISGAPSARTVATYKRRLFATDNTKTVYWSAVDDPDTWTTAGGGGSAPVETFDTEPVVGMAPVGGSLLLFKANSIARYTGVLATDINIDLDTEGVSADVGCIAPQSIARFDQFVFFLSDRGPYAATEAGTVAIGAKIEDQFDGRDWSDAVAVNHRGAREIWLWSPGLSEGWCYNYRLEAWTGPHDLSSTYDVYSAATFEDANGYEGVIYGGGDGFVRDGDNGDNGAKHDVTSSDTGGTNITCEAEMPTLFFGDPTAVKIAMGTQWIGADLKTDGSLQVITTGDQCASSTIALASIGAGVEEYDFRAPWRGRRLTLKLKDATDEEIQISSFKGNATLGRRST